MTLEIRPSSDPSVYNLYVNGYLAVSEQSREVCETIASNLLPLARLGPAYGRISMTSACRISGSERRRKEAYEVL